MRNYFIVLAYCLLVFVCVNAFLRILIGKSENTLAKLMGEESGIVGLEVTKVEESKECLNLPLE